MGRDALVSRLAAVLEAHELWADVGLRAVAEELVDELEAWQTEELTIDWSMPWNALERIRLRAGGSVRIHC